MAMAMWTCWSDEYDDHNHLLRSQVVMWLNDGAAGFAHSDRFVLDTEEEHSILWLLAGQPLGEAVRLLWYRGCSDACGALGV